VVSGKSKLQVPQPKPLVLTDQFDLKSRKASEASFDSLSFGVAIFTDANSDCNVYISEKGAIAALAR
jgi:hypothetical protein